MLVWVISDGTAIVESGNISLSASGGSVAMINAIVYFFRFGGSDSLVGALYPIALVCASNNGLVLIQVHRTPDGGIRRQIKRHEIGGKRQEANNPRHPWIVMMMSGHL